MGQHKYDPNKGKSSTFSLKNYQDYTALLREAELEEPTQVEKELALQQKWSNEEKVDSSAPRKKNG